MAKVIYRGVEYDSKEYNAKVLAEAAKRNRHELMYRGLKVVKKLQLNTILKECLTLLFLSNIIYEYTKRDTKTNQGSTQT